MFLDIFFPLREPTLCVDTLRLADSDFYCLYSDRGVSSNTRSDSPRIFVLLNYAAQFLNLGIGVVSTAWTACCLWLVNGGILSIFLNLQILLVSACERSSGRLRDEVSSWMASVAQVGLGLCCLLLFLIKKQAQTAPTTMPCNNISYWSQYNHLVHQDKWDCLYINLTRYIQQWGICIHKYLYRLVMQMEFESTIKNIIDQKSLRWIFVGGKGGVGKTTTSSSLAVLLSQHRKVLIISTDPAHNLSDCFDQKFGKDPSPIAGFENLFGMEIDPKVDPKKLEGYELLSGIQQQDQGTKNLLGELLSSVPGIDEAMSFSQLINSIQKMEFDVIVFDTAPTGHTLRFLNFPTVIQKGIEKILTFKAKFNTILGSLGNVFGSKQQLQVTVNKIFGKLDSMKQVANKVNNQMKNPDLTTFVAVCIPQFLSMYQTERLIQELANFNIDIHNIVINQVLFPDDDCKMCNSRSKMQLKYLTQIVELYDDFNVTIMPLQEEEIRGEQKLRAFSTLLLQKKEIPKIRTQ